jgi:shikimate kinase
VCIAPAEMFSENHPADHAARQSITLVGLMGVGKSSVGRRVAQRLGMSFVDADDEIVLAAGMSIPEIFERYGEAHFRDGERRVIARLIDGERKVIATGGGAFINPETRALLLGHSLVVWLDADIETLVQRVSRRNDRPLLQNGNPRDILTKLANERNPIYATAHVHVKSQAAPHDATVDAIIRAIQ